jgi:two-component system, NtrC family, response regulator HydG
MRAEDLDHGELLELNADAGVIRFAGQRALLLDAVAMGLLRKYLVENFGMNAARTVLTQFGFAHGWRMAEAMKAEFQWDTTEDWIQAGTRIHALEGLFHVQPGTGGPLSKQGVMILASYEAEQHLLHFGRTDSSVCWTICGLTSGYLSRTLGKDVYVMEDRCMAKGHASCHLFARTREEWGEERAADLMFFDPSRLEESLDVSLQRVMASLKGAERKLTEHRRALVHVATEVEEPLGLIAKSPTMRTFVELALRVAKVDATVLITGESGSGKERVARLLHEESMRAAGPFVAINCGAITESLLESELFGHTRGSFTGATHDRAGLFESAHGGTLFLDEVGEISPGMQVKLLRALQEREIRRVGENRTRTFDVRVVAATNRDLLHIVQGGGFRQDLYYRLKVIELHLPALRERRADILPLARVLLASAALRMQRKLIGLAPNVADQLLRYDWPGNVRELENAMERAAALARSNRVELEDLPEEIRAMPPPKLMLAAAAEPGPVRPLAEVEREYILAALEQNGGNQTHTAAQLGIGSATLYRRLKAYGLVGKPAEAK